ncbi:flavanone 7-O-glucoside 2''-O-beta-L-rhamnosyltransferase [Dorcoceras hygrometricum]|uniref:Glycosyltransferase n=1 Tax=Dorcoceras hygrometricum TaxID=472368 RepID=A0A2Z7C5C2_9LAMI|nr:flavanone 7-O-glucoside 2''-O-beta-L-rhamnosyltransferase [Dorcoceras hygrometricum]
MSREPQHHKILMFPWLAHGHISPFAVLAKKLIPRNFQVFLCSTPVNLESFRESINEPSLEFVELHLSSSELPAKYHTTKNLPTHLMPALKTVFIESKENFRNILKNIQPDVLVYDFMQPWASVMASEEGIRSTVLFPCGAACTSCIVHYAIQPEKEFPFESLRFSRTEREKNQILNAATDSDNNKEDFLRCFGGSSASSIMINTSNKIEAKYISYLSELVKKEVVSVGFLIQEPAKKSDDRKLMDWLCKKNPKSVVFVSFGSEYFLTKEEAEEVALGLEISGVPFIWVVRFPEGEEMDLDDALPQGFRKRIGDRGMIVEGWAPQAKILKHPNVGGFLSHCGWNSILEAVTCGVPVIAMPMQLDQPMNSRLVPELGIGIEVRRDGEVYTRKEIAKAVKKVVVEEEGKEMARNVDKLSGEVRGNFDDEMDLTVSMLVQLAKGR